jgi:hypothetical protein
MMRGPSIQGIAKRVKITWLCLYGCMVIWLCHSSGYFRWILNMEPRNHFQVTLRLVTK